MELDEKTVEELIENRHWAEKAAGSEVERTDREKYGEPIARFIAGEVVIQYPTNSVKAEGNSYRTLLSPRAKAITDKRTEEESFRGSCFSIHRGRFKFYLEPRVYVDKYERAPDGAKRDRTPEELEEAEPIFQGKWTVEDDFWKRVRKTRVRL